MLLVAVLGSPSQAWANGMPSAAFPGPAGGSLRPAAETAVAVVREHLRFDLREREARVTATYFLRNESPVSAQVLVAFPVPSPAPEMAPVVQTDGVDVHAELASGFELETTETCVPATWLDPFTGAPYLPPVGRVGVEPRGTPVITFRVDFAGGQERQLRVEYPQSPGYDYTRFIERAERYDYFLRPARHWKTFGALEIEVLAPGDRPVYGTVPLNAEGDGRYVARLGALPDENLSLFLGPEGSSPGWLSSLWWQRTGRAWILSLLTVVGAVPANWLIALRRRPLQVTGHVLRLGWPVLIWRLTPTYLFEPNPGGAITTFFLFLPALALLYLLTGWGVRRLSMPKASR